MNKYKVKKIAWENVGLHRATNKFFFAYFITRYSFEGEGYEKGTRFTSVA